MLSKLAVAAVLLVAVAGAFADDFTNNCNVQKKICQNGGVCHENLNALGTDAGSKNAWVDPFCICQAPYGGNDCSATIRECKDNPCQNGATCSPADCQVGPAAQYYDCFTCTCAHGWTGAKDYQTSSTPNGLCDWKKPGMDCSAQNLCANGGTCTDSNTVARLGYSCACSIDWFGGSTGQTANRAYNCTKPRCSQSAGACQNGGTCNNPTTNPICGCPTGYAGDYCEIPPPCNDPNACPAGNTCSNTLGSNGYYTATCTPPSFCSTNPCQNGGTCSGSTCSCVAPHDGQNSCNSTLFCQSNPCMNGASCFNTLSPLGNEGICQCTHNFGGQFCEKPKVGCDQDRAACAYGATCNTNDWISTCHCPNSATGGIQYFDCGCNSTTTSRCPGTAGSLTGQIADMVCQNGGVCAESADQTFCQCRPGFWGDNCQNYDNPCLNNPCENGGACYITAETNGLGVGVAVDDRYWAYRCKCKWPYYGKNCDKVAPIPGADGLDPVVCGADNSPCMNGGTCSRRAYSRSAGGYFRTNEWTLKQDEAEPWQCLCPTVAVSGSVYAWQGATCESQIEQCAATTCQNNGKCSQGSRGPTCACPCGYAGERCEFPATNGVAASLANFASDGAGGVGYHLEFCSREPCQNGGTCYHTTDGVGFGCNCKSGWGGSYCQYTVRSSAAGVVPSLIAVAAAVAAAFALKH